MIASAASCRAGRLTRRAAIAALASFALAAAACDDGGSGPPRIQPTLAGSYGVVEVNGRVVPVALRLTDQQSGASLNVTVSSGLLVLEEGGAYTLTVVLAFTGQQPVGRIDNGTYTETRGQIALHSASGAEGAGTWSGNDITVSIPFDIDGDGDRDSTLDLLVSKSPGTLR